MTIGIDLGDIWSHYCTLNEDGEVVDRGRFRTNPSGSTSGFGTLRGCGSPWKPEHTRSGSASSIKELGHEVIVANVRELRAISHSDRKSDKVDAEKLARYARLDPEILRPIAHRTVAQQETLTLIRARDVLVRLRTGCGELGARSGQALRVSASRLVHPLLRQAMPGCAAARLARALGPLLHQIADMTVKIKEYDRAIKQLTETEYPGDAGAHQGLRCRPSHGADLRADAGQAKNASSEVAMWAAISACGRDAASPETATLSSASPKPAMATCAAAGRVRQPRHRATWKRLNLATVGSQPGCTRRKPCPKIEPSWPWPGSLPFCCIGSGSHRRLYVPFYAEAA